MRVEVALTQHLVADMHPGGVPGDTAAVVIDLLRFSSTTCAALAAGARGVYPVADVEAARARAAAFGAPGGGASGRGAVLGGERDCLPPPGFDLGNSPGDYTAEVVGGRPVVLCTTNGSRAVAAVRGAAVVLCGALLNAEATARALVAGGAGRVLLVCSGSRDRVALDDVAAAGCLAGSLALMAGAEPDDGARTAVAVFDAWRHDLAGMLARSVSGRRLAAVGLQRDLEFCGGVDTVPLVAQLEDDRFVRADRG